MTTFQESRRAQIVKALESVDKQQDAPNKPKSEAQLEAARSAAAIALNAAYLRERESRFGKAAPRVTAADVLAEALKDSRTLRAG
jgi:GDP-D-mannose dehydratase